MFNVIPIFFLKSDELEKKMKTQPKYANFLTKLKRFTESIGFRRQIYKTLGNTQTEIDSENSTVQIINGRRVRIMPSSLIADYDSENFHKTNPSLFDKDIYFFENKKSSIDNLFYQRQFVSETDLVIEKRLAQDDLIISLIKDYESNVA